jgi:Immunity protein 7
MFEFHGWAVVRPPYPDGEGYHVIGGRDDEAIKRVRAAINEAHDECSEFEVRRTSNGLIVLTAHGLRNHRYEPVIGLFRWLIQAMPDSYGLLYVHDDEDDEHPNEFRVCRLAQGQFGEHAEPFLSPYVPTVEPP